MNPEEEFDKWWRKEQATSLRFPGDKEIWLAAYRLGLTRAAEIAKNHMPDRPDPIGPLHGAGRASSAMQIRIAIMRECNETAILTERDKAE